MDDVVNMINLKFGGLNMTNRKEHKNLLINLIFNEDGTVIISMNDYVDEVINICYESDDS